MRRRCTRVAARRGASLLAAAPRSAARGACGSPARAAALVALGRRPGQRRTPWSPRAPRAKPFRLVRSDGRRAISLGAFGAPGADYADVAAGAAGPRSAVFARPTTDGYAYESAGRGAPERLGEGTGAPVLALDGTTRIAAYPDDDGDAAISRDGADDDAHDAPARRCAPRRSTSSSPTAPARARPRAVAHPLAAARARARRARPRRSSPSPGCGRSRPRSRATARRVLRRLPRRRAAARARHRRAGAPAPAGRGGGCACAGRSNGAPAVAARRAAHDRRHEPARRAPLPHLPDHASGPPAPSVRRLTRAAGGSDLAAARRDRPGRPRLRRLDPPPRAVARAAPRCCAECSEAAVRRW